MGEGRREASRVEFDRSVKVEFHGANVTSDAGLLAFRELDEVLCLTGMVAGLLVDTRTGLNTRHTPLAQFRQSVYSRLAGYEDTNDAELPALTVVRHSPTGDGLSPGLAHISQIDDDFAGPNP